MDNTAASTIANVNARSTILRLNNDVLWFIFKMNADMFSYDDALKTARFTAQVCIGWRDVMLQSPSLWGRLIDLDALPWMTDAWRDEVLRRTGNSLLWVKAHNRIVGKPASRANFFFSLLNNHWNRIQKFVVRLNMKELKHQSWDTLSLPSPHLQVFDLELSSSAVVVTPPLFGNDAPMLHRFYGRFLKFNMIKSSWGSKIRSVHLGAPFRMIEILQALETMKSLEYLQIDSVVNPEDRDALNGVALINLPQLNHLKLFGGFEGCVVVLEHINAPPNCCLIFRAKLNPPDDIAQDDFKALLQPLSKFTQTYFLSQTPKKVFLDCSPPKFQFMDSSSPHDAGFNIWISLWKFLGERAEVVALLLSAFAHPELSTVAELQWKFPSALAHSTFIYFFSSLSSINILETDEHSVDNLIRIQDMTPGLLFPILQVLKLGNLDLGNSTGPFGVISPFLRSRKEAGHPIKILDLRECILDISPPLEFLDEMADMKVLWPDNIHR